MQIILWLFVIYLLSIWLYSIAAIEDHGYKGGNWAVVFLMTIFVTITLPVLAVAAIVRTIRAKMACTDPK